MKNAAFGIFLIFSLMTAPVWAEYRRIAAADYLDKMKAGWIGQMAGVGWGGPTEGVFCGVIVPEDKIPAWRPELINQFHQDDMYVEMIFLQTLERYGLHVSARQAGIDFANSPSPLWCANFIGRQNLRRGIAPPDSGHPQFSKRSDDIDYQIEADFSGLIAPGMPNLVIELGEKFGRLMNYGDGLYAGQFMGAMYAEAFFNNNIEEIIAAGLAAIPAESQYAECVRDVVNWHRQNPDDWEKTWQLIHEKYHLNPDYQRYNFSAPLTPTTVNIDAKINGAYVVMGLLYGQGDMDKTIIISMRCGHDSDCNPSSAAGVLATTIGFSRLPEKYVSAINMQEKFIYSPYTFPLLVDLCGKLARQAIFRQGGHIEADADGNEVFVIPVEKPNPGRLEQSWRPQPIAGNHYSPGEMRLIAYEPWYDISADAAKFAPGWKVINCGREMDPGFRPSYNGRENVLVTHPITQETGCTLSQKVKIPENQLTTLKLIVGHHDADCDWLLIVKVNGKKFYQQIIGKDVSKDGWVTVEIPLTEFAGRDIDLELVNQPNGWKGEAAYWGEINIFCH